MSRSAVAAVLVSLSLLVACDQRSVPVQIAEVVRHESGILAPRPQGLSLDPDPRVLRFIDAASVRQPLTVEVRPTTEGPPKSAETRSLGGTDMPFELTELGTYSGGTEYRLRVWRKTDAGWIEVTAQQQSDATPPDFAAAWAVLEGAQLDAQRDPESDNDGWPAG